jgi:hypothetical protein
MVTPALISVPALVMNDLTPSTIHSPSLPRARVLVPPASEPASGSVRPKAQSLLPASRSGSHRSLCSAVPKLTIGLMPSETAASSVIATAASARAISSSARQ